MIYGMIGLHLFSCIIIGILHRMRIIKTRAMIFPAVCLVPITGFLLLFVEVWEEQRRRMGERPFESEQLKVQDIRYQQIQVESDENQQITVPLEEAMVINDESVRRRLMLDILRREPENNIPLLQEARLTDDTELSHYATTAMMEIQSRYEMELYQLEEKRKKFPSNQKVLKVYCRNLQTYINSRLISGTILNIYQDKLDEVLERLIETEPEHKNYRLEWINNRISLGRLENIEKEIRLALEMWPEEELLYQSYIAYGEKMQDGNLIESVINEMKEKHIYLSSSGKKWFQFWTRGEE